MSKALIPILTKEKEEIILKRILSLIAVAALILAAVGLTACGGDTVPAGNYTIIHNSGSVDPSWNDATIQAHEDGSATLIRHKEVNGSKVSAVSGISFKSGKITVDDTEYPYTCQDGKLTLTSDSGSIVFEVEK